MKFEGRLNWLRTPEGKAASNAEQNPAQHMHRWGADVGEDDNVY